MQVLVVSLKQIIYLAGLAQIALVLGSLAIPTMLNWRAELVKVNPLIKQMFWTYAAYILVINLCFGLVSAFAAGELINHSVLAGSLTAFIAVYWLSRILIQFFYFDRQNFPVGYWYKLGEFTLVLLFIALTAVYAWAAYFNLQA